MDYFPVSVSKTLQQENSSKSSSQKSTLEKKKSQNSKQLPNNFFERVIDLEMMLDREFLMSTLLELVNLYSVR